MLMNRLLVLATLLAIGACASPAPPTSPSGATLAPPTSSITPMPNPSSPSLSPTSPPLRATASAAPATPSASGQGPSPSASTGPASRLLVSTYVVTTYETLDPLTGARASFSVPPGTRWVVTGPATIALTLGAEDAQAVVVVARLVGGTATEMWRASLPSDDRWLGGHAACLWGDEVIVADGGLDLYRLLPGNQPEAIPSQKGNLGNCTWLDATHVLWDQEEGNPLRVWSVGDSTAATLTIRGSDPSSGGSRLAWQDGFGVLHIADYSIIGGQVTAQARMLSLPESGGSLSPDGRWLAVRSESAPGVLIIHELDGAAPPVERSRIALGDNEYAIWLPPSL